MLQNFISCLVLFLIVINMAKQPVMVYLDVEDMEKLEDLSRETGRPLSVIVREAVKRFLKQS